MEGGGGGSKRTKKDSAIHVEKKKKRSGADEGVRGGGVREGEELCTGEPRRT